MPAARTGSISCAVSSATRAPTSMPAARLICEIGQGRGQLEDDYPDLNWMWLDTQRERRRSVLHSRGGSAGVETQTTGLRRWPTRQSDERSDEAIQGPQPVAPRLLRSARNDGEGGFNYFGGASLNKAAGSQAKKRLPRSRQAEIFAQRRPFVFRPEQAAPLQFGNDLVDEIVEALGQKGEHHVEAVGAALDEPLLHRSAIVFDRADEGEAGIAAEPLRELAHRQFFSLRERDDAIAAALAGVDSGISGNGPSGSNREASAPSAIDSEAMRALVVHEAVELAPASRAPRRRSRRRRRRRRAKSSDDRDRARPSRRAP